MIKFFRKIRQNLLSEGKTGKYLKYAIGEIILVVIGILIALQVNNWNQDRLNVKAAADYEHRLLEDIYEEKAILGAVIQYQSTVRSYALRAIEVLESGLLTDNDSASGFLIDLYQASQLQYPTSAISTYQELISSGQIGMIADDSLRSAIITYYNYDWTNMGIIVNETPYRENLRKVIPNSIQSTIRQDCGDIYVNVRKSLRSVLPEKCDLQFDQELATYTVNEIFQYESLKSDLRFKIGILDGRLQLLNNYSGELTDIINQMEVTE